MTKLNLLSLLLLTQLLVPSSAEAFFGWGKFPSRLEAEEACDKWVKDGAIETYKTEAPLSKAEIEEKVRPIREAHYKQRSKIIAERKANPSKRIKMGAGYYDPYDIQLNVGDGLYKSEVAQIKSMTKPVTRERPTRSCKREDETKQFIGIDKSKATKHFRY